MKMLPKTTVSRRKTNEQFIFELNNVNENILPMTPYIKAREKMEFKCLLCNYEWSATPDSVLRSSGCRNCANNTLRQQRVKSHEQYIDDLKNNDINLVPIEKYTGAYKKIKHQCLKCGYIFEGTPNTILNGYSSCLICNNKGRRLTSDLYYDLLERKFPNIVPATDFISMTSPMSYTCTVCGNQWTNKTSNQILNTKYGCKKCSVEKISQNLTQTHYDFLNRLSSEIKNTINIKGQYIGIRDTISVECRVCGKIWDTTPHYLLRGNGCSRCAGNEKKTTSQFATELYSINKHVSVIGEYNGSHNNILVKCNICNHKWNSLPTNLLKNEGCPICCLSHGEKRIIEYLENNQIDYVSQKKYDNLVGINNGLLSYDFYLPSFNKFIEFQGEQHEHPVKGFCDEEQFKVQQEHDRRKREYAQNNDIELIEIWYYDINNVEKILKEKLNLESVTTAGCA